jgi:serine phosphatase RsbU (regulator of sigma subunit)/anti-sigma regulatory factor (Ser/Thr protein kinase)
MAEAQSKTTSLPPVDIADNDPLLGYLLTARGAVSVSELNLESPALEKLKAAGVALMVPLVSSGELIGVLNLGPRLSEQEYSSDDRRLLESLAGQAAPALRVGQLVREQEAEAATRQRYEQELEVARLIQQNFLPKELPDLPGWNLAAYYRPARQVGGDFYDVIPLADGRVGLVIGDVTDKGVPAALVMSATRSVLRASAQRLIEPGAVLERVNDHLCPDMPEKMFVTCLYGVLDVHSGRLRFANAGHDVPYVKRGGEVYELRARGMPLGLMSDMNYEEKETVLEPGDSVLLHSDGIVESHDSAREMYGFPRLKQTVAVTPQPQQLIDTVLTDLATFTGPGAEQEDDITMVVLERVGGRGEPEHMLADFQLPSRPGGEREAMAQVTTAVEPLGLAKATLDRLGTAVGEATMNAMEHANQYSEELPVRIRVFSAAGQLHVDVSDAAHRGELRPAETPNLEAKLHGDQSPRGWGLFLIKNMVDEATMTTDENGHTVHLTLRLEGGTDGSA